MLAEFEARLRVADETRKRTKIRTIAIAAVAVVHVLFVLLLIASQWIHVPVKRIVVQPMTWLTLQDRPNAVPDLPDKPRKPEQSGYFNPKLVPKFVRPKDDKEESNAIDFGYALGRSLACGASSYEWLNPKMRAECRHKPWQFVYDRNGNIVLDAVPSVPREDKPRPSDIQAHERNTAPTCPQNVDPNAPCLSAIIGGRP